MVHQNSGLKIFSGSSNRELASQIANSLGVRLGRSRLGTFSDGETCVGFDETVRGCDVFLVQSTCAPVNDNLMELCLMCDACRRASAGRITAVMPYFGYARQDRKAKTRDPISAKVVANLITVSGADRVLTMDLHASQIQGFFDIPVDHLLGSPLLAKYFARKFKNRPEDIVIVSPDFGSVSRARHFAQRLPFPVTIAIIDKRRQRANVSEVMNIIGDVREKTVIMVDDMIDTAGTLCNAARAVIEIGGAKEVYACATHGVLSGPAVERLRESPLKELVLLDTIPQDAVEQQLPMLKLLSVAPVFSEAIDRIYESKPVSPLYSV